mgnify:CR=1 FL=1
MSKNALTVENLNKTYSDSKTKKENHALTNLTFDVKEGEVFGLLGPNGAGKTTFLSILGGTVTKTSGLVNVWGFDLDKNPRQVKASIGIVPQEVNLDAFFSPKKLLELQAGLYGIAKKDRITDLILKMVALEDKANAYSRSLSGGMKRRLLIAKAMVHQPPILILDEPTAGVDVELRNNLWNNVKKLNNEGVTIILTTHYIEEAEEIADRVGIINNGKIIIVDEKSRLIKKLGQKILKIEINSKIDRIPKSLEIYNLQISNEGKTIIYFYDTKSERTGITALLSELKNNGIQLKDITTEQSSLESIFLNLLKESKNELVRP